MIKYMVSCLDDDFKTRVLASKSRIFTSINEAIQYSKGVAPERKPNVVHVLSAETAAESAYFQMVEHYPERAFDRASALTFIVEEDSRDDSVTVVFVGDKFAVGFPKTDGKYFDSYFYELLMDGGAE
jgi:hypothetical protein